MNENTTIKATQSITTEWKIKFKVRTRWRRTKNKNKLHLNTSDNLVYTVAIAAMNYFNTSNAARWTTHPFFCSFRFVSHFRLHLSTLFFATIQMFNLVYPTDTQNYASVLCKWHFHCFWSSEIRWQLIKDIFNCTIAQ